MKNRLGKLQQRIFRYEQSEAYLMDLINNREESIWSIDKDYNFVIINDFFAKTYFSAYHVEIKEGMNALELLSPELAQLWKPQYEAALNGENIVFELSEIIDGKQHYYEVKLGPVFRKHKIVGVSAISSDITERKQAEDTLVKTKDRLSNIILAANDGNWDWDLATNVVTFDKRYYEMAGYEVDEFPHKLEEFQARVHPDDVDYVMDMAQKYLDGKINHYKTEFRFKKKNGEWLWIYGRGLIIERDENGVPLRFVGTHTDITERKKAEEALKDSMELFRTTLYSIGDAVITTDKESRIININPVAEELTGWKEEEAFGQSLEKIFHIINEQSGKTVENPTTKVLQEGTIVGLANHTVLISKDGKEIPIADSGAPIKNEKGAVIGVVLVFRDQTKEREAKRKAEESLSRLKRAEFTSKSGNWELHLTTKTIIASEGAGMVYGINSQKMDYELVKNAPFVEYRPLLDNALKNLIEKDEPYDVEFKIKTFDTDETKDIHSIAFYDKERKIIFGVIQDITERKQAQEEINRNTVRYKALISVSNTGAWEYHLSTDFLWCSPEYFSMLGRDVNDFDFSGKSNLKETWIDLLHPEDRERASNHFAEYLKNGSVGMYENYFRMKHKDGHWVWILSRGQTLRDEKGNITDLTDGTHIDISGQKRDEQVQKILYNIANAVFTTDNVSELISIIREELGTLIDTTNFFVAMYEAKTDTFLLPFFKDEFDDFVTFPAAKTITRYVVETGKPLMANLDELKELEKAGKIERYGKDSLIWLGVPLKVGGKVTGAMVTQSYSDENAFNESDKKLLEIISGEISLAIHRKNAEQELQELNEELAAQNEEYEVLNEELTDSMERIKRINAELENAKEKAEESNRLKTAFLHNMSHEIRTPMNGIFGFSELLKEPNLTGDQQQKYIDVILKSGNRMLNTINDLMDISMIESGHEKLELSVVNINEQIESLYTFFKPEAEKKGLQLRVNQPNPIREVVVQTDKEKLYAILTNLVKNAIKYTPEGFVEFGYDEKEDQLNFFIKDSGIGIPKNRRKAIFDRFVQADIEDRGAYEGSGLGLSISKAYVEMLGGKIWVESEEGEGSQFYFTIPFITENKEVETVKEKISGKKLKAQVKKLKVLIVEDEETSDTYLTIVIKKYSREVLHAKNGREAVDICRDNPDIDLALMDIKMPVMGGYEATRKIREFNKEVIIIAQTAYAFPDDVDKAKVAGCNDYISKPIKINELLEKIALYFKEDIG